MADVSHSGLSIFWEQVLDKVQRSLEQAENAAAEREKIALQIPTDVLHESVAFRRAETRAGSWHERLQDVKTRVDLADAELAAGEDAFKHWHAQLQCLGQDLAQWAGRVIR